MKLEFIGLIILLLFLTSLAALKAQSFVHPGILHSQEDLDRMKKR